MLRRQKMLEKHIEQKLVQAVKKASGIAPKLICPGFDGMPDRLVLLPNGKMAFVELKAPGKKPRPLQIKRHGVLRAARRSVSVPIATLNFRFLICDHF
jgi:hypothetical protein